MVSVFSGVVSYLVPTPHLSPSSKQFAPFCRLWDKIVMCSGFSHFGRATPKLHVGKCPFPKAATVPKIALSQKLHMLQNQHFPKCFLQHLSCLACNDLFQNLTCCS